MSLKGDGELPLEVKRVLPDLTICRARRSETTGLVYCLVSRSDDCEQVGLFDDDHFCFHPEVEKILANTQANPRR
jgi:hypothetical protein